MNMNVIAVGQRTATSIFYVVTTLFDTQHTRETASKRLQLNAELTILFGHAEPDFIANTLCVASPSRLCKYQRSHANKVLL